MTDGAATATAVTATTGVTATTVTTVITTTATGTDDTADRPRRPAGLTADCVFNVTELLIADRGADATLERSRNRLLRAMAVRSGHTIAEQRSVTRGVR